MTHHPGQSPAEMAAWTARIQARIDAALAAEHSAADPCPACDGKGYGIWVYPQRQPTPAHWFSRGPQGQRAFPCDKCDGTGAVV
jgi:hypothetical protein